MAECFGQVACSFECSRKFSVHISPPLYFVYSLAAYNNSLFVGGGFTNAGGSSANRIAQWTATSSSTQDQTRNQPKGYALEQNYPNPFNPTTVISYQLPTASNVSLKVYDVLGKEVMTLVSGRQAAGSYTYTLNASNLASGVYFYKQEARQVARPRLCKRKK
ncbi:MAG: T9SS type A sorting domain-containing protein [Chloroherpetonaceae bacterium]